MAFGPLLANLRSPYDADMKDMLVIPTGALPEASLAIARSSESQSIVDHSIRSFLFARLLADEEGCLDDADYNEDLLFAATVMHDLGLGEHATGEARFEVEGADLAATVLREHGVAEPEIDPVWRRSPCPSPWARDRSVMAGASGGRHGPGGSAVASKVLGHADPTRRRACRREQGR